MRACAFLVRGGPLLSLVVLAAGVTMLSSGCSRRVTDFTVISTKNTMLVAHAEEGPRRITGEDCTFTLVGLPNMKTAIDDAIEKAGPGYDALVDGVVWYDDRFLYVCYRVEGTPLRAADLPPSQEIVPEADDADDYQEPAQTGRTERGNRYEIREERSAPPARPEPAAPDDELEEAPRVADEPDEESLSPYAR